MIKQYQENKNIVSRLDEQQEKKWEEKLEQQRKIHNKYLDLKSELNEKEEEETNTLNEGFEKGEAKIKESIAEHSIIIDQVERILTFKGIVKRPIDLSFEVKTYNDKSLELIDTIKTPCLELRTCIYENDKPKNKYALVVVGKSIFAYYEKLGKFPQTYGLHLNHQGSNISMHLRDAPAVDKLKEYYNKNKDKFLNDFLAQHTELEEEYRVVQRDNNTPEWERLYWENKKEYYEKEYSRGTETEEYKTVLRELTKLNGLI